MLVSGAFGEVRIPGRRVAVARRPPPVLRVGAAVGVGMTTAAPARATGGWSGAAIDLMCVLA